MKTKRKSLPLRIIAVCAICALDLLCGVGYLYYVNMRGGTIFYASHASDNICGTLRQGLIVAACPFLLLLDSVYMRLSQNSQPNSDTPDMNSRKER